MIGNPFLSDFVLTWLQASSSSCRNRLIPVETPLTDTTWAQWVNELQKKPHNHQSKWLHQLVPNFDWPYIFRAENTSSENASSVAQGWKFGSDKTYCSFPLKYRRIIIAKSLLWIHSEVEHEILASASINPIFYRTFDLIKQVIESFQEWESRNIAKENVPCHFLKDNQNFHPSICTALFGHNSRSTQCNCRKDLARLPILVWSGCRLAQYWRLLTWYILLLTVPVLRANVSSCQQAHRASQFPADKHWLAFFYRLACANMLLVTPTGHVIGVKWVAGRCNDPSWAQSPSVVQNIMSTCACISYA